MTASHLTIGIDDLADVVHTAASPRLLAAGIDTHLRPSGDFWIRLGVSGLDTKWPRFEVSIECSHGGAPYGSGDATTITRAIDLAINEAEATLASLASARRAKGGRNG